MIELEILPRLSVTVRLSQRPLRACVIQTDFRQYRPTVSLHTETLAHEQESFEDVDQHCSQLTKAKWDMEAQVVGLSRHLQEEEEEDEGLHGRAGGKVLQLKARRGGAEEGIRRRDVLPSFQLQYLLEQESKQRTDMEKSCRKVEGDSKTAVENLDELETMKTGMEKVIETKDLEINTMTEKLEEEEALSVSFREKCEELQGVLRNWRRKRPRG
ncbi:myosin-6-like [Arapaima gigas]